MNLRTSDIKINILFNLDGIHTNKTNYPPYYYTNFESEILLSLTTNNNHKRFDLKRGIEIEKCCNLTWDARFNEKLTTKNHHVGPTLKIHLPLVLSRSRVRYWQLTRTLNYLSDFLLPRTFNPTLCNYFCLSAIIFQFIIFLIIMISKKCTNLWISVCSLLYLLWYRDSCYYFANVDNNNIISSLLKYYL